MRTYGINLSDYIMKREELYTLKSTIEDCFNLTGLEFIHRISLIYNQIKEHIDIFEKHRPAISDEYTKYVNEKNLILDKYAARDENGAYISNKQGIILTNPIAYSSALTELKQLYSTAIEEHKDNTKEFTSFLESEFEFNFTLIPYKYIPSNITLGQYIGISSLIEKN